ncbi:hypothetical protein LPJ53_005957 [Coemansia erecta]|uniref:F-box domain-containing protein n=1 Tax=Coemansia erecta TaxID=147472 RepID=A0A9W8CN84_9FUNG|nr:hypothetical protein LPJ53_005957 [Coemansia erecta]
MDSRQSLFQKLPADIISKIIGLIPDERRNRCFLEADKVALVQVCHAWRNVAASKFLNRLEIDIQDSWNVTYEYLGYSKHKYPFKIVSHSYVGILIIRCDLVSLESDSALDWIEMINKREFQFPEAQILHFTLVDRPGYLTFPFEYVALTFREFIEKVKRHTPNVKLLTSKPEFIKPENRH